ncbi:MAG: hypothetical protein WDN49_08750 [Acetobacteraceae bacterium]
MIEPQFLPLLQRVAASLATEPGTVDIVGYTDNQPIHTVAFPSNLPALGRPRESRGRDHRGPASTPRGCPTEGRADADPIASNDTPARAGTEPPHRGRSCAEAGISHANRSLICSPISSTAGRRVSPASPSPACWSGISGRWCRASASR